MIAVSSKIKIFFQRAPFELQRQKSLKEILHV